MSDIDTVRDALQLAMIHVPAEYSNSDVCVVRDAVKALQSIEEENKRLREATEWRDIASAPRDGTTVWGCDWKNGYRGMVSFNGKEWELVDEFTNMPKGIGFYPTHWRRLPESPATIAGENR